MNRRHALAISLMFGTAAVAVVFGLAHRSGPQAEAVNGGGSLATASQPAPTATGSWVDDEGYQVDEIEQEERE